MAEDAPWLGLKPEFRKPAVFKGDPEDIDRFLTQCEMYFQVHAAYMFASPYRVAFAASCFSAKAEDWWTMELLERRSNTRNKFRLPSWDQFCSMLHREFRDHAVEEVQQKKMYDLRLGKSNTEDYFQALEQFAKTPVLEATWLQLSKQESPTPTAP